MSPALDRLPQRPFASVAAGRFRFVAVLAIVTAFYALCLHYADIDLERLWTGIPRLIAWAMRAWPPDFAELDLLLARALETLAIATIGTTIGAVIAVPACVLAARNLTPNSFLRTPARWVLNALRGIDSFVFALLFVAAVGLGPFAGVLGVALHSAGTIAKLWSEAIEAIEPGPIEAVAMTGATRTKIVVFAVLPDVLPSLTSIVLYVWEVNARASTVLGLVGAGGIGLELQASISTLAWPQASVIFLLILGTVVASEWLSARIRHAII